MVVCNLCCCASHAPLADYHNSRQLKHLPSSSQDLCSAFPNSLSLQGLAVQAVIFTLISVVWIWCLPFPYHELKGNMGWIIVDSFVFAFGQAVVLALALHCVSLDELTMQ